MMIECPHCHMETEHKVIDHINIDRNPELRAKVQDLSVFRVKCPNCGETLTFEFDDEDDCDCGCDDCGCHCED